MTIACAPYEESKRDDPLIDASAVTICVEPASCAQPLQTSYAPLQSTDLSALTICVEPGACAQPLQTKYAPLPTRYAALNVAPNYAGALTAYEVGERSSQVSVQSYMSAPTALAVSAVPSTHSSPPYPQYEQVAAVSYSMPATYAEPAAYAQVQMYAAATSYAASCAAHAGQTPAAMGLATAQWWRAALPASTSRTAHAAQPAPAAYVAPRKSAMQMTPSAAAQDSPFRFFLDAVPFPPSDLSPVASLVKAVDPSASVIGDATRATTIVKTRSTSTRAAKPASTCCC